MEVVEDRQIVVFLEVLLDTQRVHVDDLRVGLVLVRMDDLRRVVVLQMQLVRSMEFVEDRQIVVFLEVQLDTWQVHVEDRKLGLVVVRMDDLRRVVVLQMQHVQFSLVHPDQESPPEQI